MKTVTGKSACAGIAIGRTAVFRNESQDIKRIHVEDTKGELLRVEEACRTAVGQLDELYEKVGKEVGEAGAAVFDVHRMMVMDDDFQDSIRNIILTQKVNAEYAVASTGDTFSAVFKEMQDDYMQGRAADVRDISERIIKVLTGKEEAGLETDEPVILLARDLAPSETVQLDKSRVLAFVTKEGSVNSHTAILSRTLNIPAVVGLDYPDDCDGLPAIVDGQSGRLILEPDEETLLLYRGLIREEEEKQDMLRTLKGKDTVTGSGRRLKLYANIGSSRDLGAVLMNDAEGIGLFRSEFLYLESDHFPTEEEQFQVYKMAAECMGGKKVIIRTLDLGADKQAPYFDLGKEENPAMGYRAIRICLKEKDLFRTQLRAIYRASAFGEVAVMYPMIISVREVKQILELTAEIREELKRDRIPFREIEQGIMIETPAAVMISDLLAEEVDFFSIGTNDLTQYTLAIDRQNCNLDDFYEAHHEAILRMIRMVVDNGHKKGCWVGICGELGADMELTGTFVEMGIDELSVSPPCILPIRKLIREL